MYLEEGGASLSAKQAAFLREAQKFLVGRQQVPETAAAGGQDERVVLA